MSKTNRMLIIRKAFQAKVKIGKLIKDYLYYPDEGVRTHAQARKKAKKHGRVISVEKVDTQALLGKIENLKLEQEPGKYYLGGDIYEDELNIDELLGLRKKTKRRSNYVRQREREKD